VITLRCSRQQQQRKAAREEVGTSPAEDHRKAKISGYSAKEGKTEVVREGIIYTMSIEYSMI
jgi:hypothetical protein